MNSSLSSLDTKFGVIVVSGLPDTTCCVNEALVSAGLASVSAGCTATAATNPVTPAKCLERTLKDLELAEKEMEKSGLTR